MTINLDDPGIVDDLKVLIRARHCLQSATDSMTKGYMNLGIALLEEYRSHGRDIQNPLFKSIIEREYTIHRIEYTGFLDN